MICSLFDISVRAGGRGGGGFGFLVYSRSYF